MRKFTITPQRVLAKKFGVSQVFVSRALAGEEHSETAQSIRKKYAEMLREKARKIQAMAPEAAL